MKKIMILASILVAGCSTGQPPIDISSKPANYKRQGGFDSKNYKGDVQITVRSYNLVVPEGKSKAVAQEFAGSTCKLSGAGFSNSFATPSIVRMPSFGKSTRPANATCTYQGRQKTVKIEPFNATLAAIEAKADANGAAVGGLVGLLVADISSSVRKSNRDEANDQYSYQDVAVQFGMKDN